MRRLEQQGRLTLVNAGVTISPHALWFNLAPAPAPDDRPWLREEAFRRAVSFAVDRQAIVDTVHLGAAVPIYGPITPGHGEWYLPDLPATPFNPDEARRLLASVGLTDANADGLVEDRAGRPARFSILTGRGSSVRDRTMAMVQEQLRRAGLTVDIVSLEVGAMVERWTARDYDAMFFYVIFDSFDPARSLEFWLSSGSFHFWNPRQASPATDWEARIDAVMREQSTMLDPAGRRRLFAEAQRLLAEHVPVLYFAAPQVTIAASARLRGATPSVLPPHVLWNAERLSTTGEARSARR
jgi:peptide/nickel transport system substrate-binding protein